MPARPAIRRGPRSAVAALLASVATHVALLIPLWWCLPSTNSQARERLAADELVVLVGDDEKSASPSVGRDFDPGAPTVHAEISSTNVEPPAPRSVVNDLSAATVPNSDSDRAPSVRGQFPRPEATNSSPDRGGPDAPAGTEFFQIRGTGRAVVYVLDHSMSMGLHDGLRQARVELMASIRRLPPTARFQVIAYNTVAEPLCVGNSVGLLPVDTETVGEAARLLTGLRPTGLTRHMQALQRGLDLQPDVLFFATDSDVNDPDGLTWAQVDAVTRYNGGHCAIHVIGFGDRPEDANNPLRHLATRNRGTYRRVSVKDL